MVSGKLGKRSSMLHIMVLLKFLGGYGNEAALQKLGLMLGITRKGDYAIKGLVICDDAA